MEPSLRFSCLFPYILDISTYIGTEFTEGDSNETWLKPQITESEAGMEVTSYLPAELDRA